MAIVIAPAPGEHITHYASRLAWLARKHDTLAVGEFNGTKLTCRPGHGAEWVIDLFYAMREILSLRQQAKP